MFLSITVEIKIARMKIFLFFASIFYLWTIDFGSAGVIRNDAINKLDHPLQHFESESVDVNTQNFLSNFFLSMFKQPELSYPSNLKSRNAKVSNPEINSCNHYMEPSFCPICIFRMRRRTAHANGNKVPSNYTHIEELENMKPMAETTIRHETENLIANRFQDQVDNNSSIKSENILYDLNSKERIQIHNLKSFANSGKFLNLPNIFQPFLHSWKREGEISKDNDTARFL